MRSWLPAVCSNRFTGYVPLGERISAKAATTNGTRRGQEAVETCGPGKQRLAGPAGGSCVWPN